MTVEVIEFLDYLNSIYRDGQELLVDGVIFVVALTDLDYLYHNFGATKILDGEEWYYLATSIEVIGRYKILYCKKSLYESGLVFKIINN